MALRYLARHTKVAHLGVLTSQMGKIDMSHNEAPDGLGPRDDWFDGLRQPGPKKKKLDAGLSQLSRNLVLKNPEQTKGSVWIFCARVLLYHVERCCSVSIELGHHTLRPSITIIITGKPPINGAGETGVFLRNFSRRLWTKFSPTERPRDG